MKAYLDKPIKKEDSIWQIEKSVRYSFICIQSIIVLRNNHTHIIGGTDEKTQSNLELNSHRVYL